jgi:plastocyanin
MGRRTKRAALAAVGVGLVWPAVAWADKQIQADPSNRYSTPEVTIDQGEKITFRNNDVAGHDVTANNKGPDGKPLFSTPVISQGESAFVEGSQYLTTGHYQFFCSLHQNMKGTVHVTGNGTPQPRPGAGSPATPGAPAPGAAKDEQAPALELAIMSRATRAVRRSRTLRTRVTLDEGGHVTLRAVARPRARRKLITFAVGSVHMTGAGTRNVTLKLTRAGRRALARKRQLAVVVTARARDDAGNRSTAEHGRTLGLKR